MRSSDSSFASTSSVMTSAFALSPEDSGLEDSTV
jgi:hypothetical protein